MKGGRGHCKMSSRAAACVTGIFEIAISDVTVTSMQRQRQHRGDAFVGEDSGAPASTAPRRSPKCQLAKYITNDSHAGPTLTGNRPSTAHK